MRVCMSVHRCVQVWACISMPTADLVLALGLLVLHVTARSSLPTLGFSALPVDRAALSPSSVPSLPDAPADGSADLVAPSSCVQKCYCKPERAQQHSCKMSELSAITL